MIISGTAFSTAVAAATFLVAAPVPPPAPPPPAPAAVAAVGAATAQTSEVADGVTTVHAPPPPPAVIPPQHSQPDREQAPDRQPTGDYHDAGATLEVIDGSPLIVATRQQDEHGQRYPAIGLIGHDPARDVVTCRTETHLAANQTFVGQLALTLTIDGVLQHTRSRIVHRTGQPSSDELRLPPTRLPDDATVARCLASFTAHQ